MSLTTIVRSEYSQFKSKISACFAALHQSPDQEVFSILTSRLLFSCKHFGSQMSDVTQPLYNSQIGHDKVKNSFTGDCLERWRQLKAEKTLKHNQEVAHFLMDRQDSANSSLLNAGGDILNILYNPEMVRRFELLLNSLVGIFHREAGESFDAESLWSTVINTQK